MNDQQREKLRLEAIEFEKQYGTDNFIKVAFSSLTHLLVDKGLVTKDELIESFKATRTEFQKQCEEKLIEELDKDGRVDITSFERIAGIEAETGCVTAISPDMLKRLKGGQDDTTSQS